ncbi:MAG: TlpA family protein disulfide reductase, partial [Desulfobulbaceae bacterium]|nr:TlpA family protein disulfide reductase [Desulfobulbaceae bacterium]
NFFATWCPPCRQEIPSFVRLQDELGPKGFTVIGLSIDDGSAPVARFMDKLGINYPVLMADQKVTAGFGNVVGVPTTFLVDRSGTIVKSYVGYVDHSILKRDIAAVLK